MPQSTSAAPPSHEKSAGDAVLDDADQRAALAFMGEPGNIGPDAPERIDTHGAIVFLIGARAYKIKRAVRYPYMDFSTLELRRYACEAEIARNRRTAPTLYRGTIAITRDKDGVLALDGPGQPIEWAVEMGRFADEDLLDRMAREGRLTRALMERLADRIAAFHASAGNATNGADLYESMRWVADDNFIELAAFPSEIPADEVNDLRTETTRALETHRSIFGARQAGGHVKICHGDLHLQNVCLLEGEPTLFDAIEFNDALAVIDVLYDIAFLIMDLEHRGLRNLANATFNRYLEHGDEWAGLTLLPLYLSLRAAVRAKTTASAAAQGSSTNGWAEARAYLDAARGYLVPAPPRLIAVGGLSGTGKSSVARALAPTLGRAPGAIHLRSDVIRKRLSGVDPLTRLPASAYGPGTSAPVYEKMTALAAAVIGAGHTAIVDAVFAREDERQAIAAIAQKQGTPFQGIWLDAPAEILKARVSARRGDASDATTDVVDRQAKMVRGTLDWQQVEATGDLGSVVQRVTEYLDT